MESTDGGGNMRSSMAPDEDLAPDAATTATTDAELPECDRSSPVYATFVFWISGSCVHPGGENFQICPPGCENFQITRHS